MTIDREPSPTQPLNMAVADDASGASGDEGRGDGGDEDNSGERGLDSDTVVWEESSGSSVRYRGRTGAGESGRGLGESQSI